MPQVQVCGVWVVVPCVKLRVRLACARVCGSHSVLFSVVNLVSEHQDELEEEDDERGSCCEEPVRIRVAHVVS